MTTNNSGFSRSAAFLMAIAAVVAVALLYLALTQDSGQSLRQTANIQMARALGQAAGVVMQERSNKYVPVPEAPEKVTDRILRIGGISHTQLIRTDVGNIVFDTGISLQSAEQMNILKTAAPGRTTHIILSHSHADHIGGTRFWTEVGTKVIAQENFPEEQRYLTELEPYFWGRNRMMFPWIPESPPTNGLLRYGGIEPDILVPLDAPYRFEQGGVQFEVLATPGAEGADNLCLWLPNEKVLFTGDTLGPMFPQFPNIVTLRGEKIRNPIDYINTLEVLISLEPEILVPSHNSIVRGKEQIRSGLTRIRDAVRYVHDETIAGMNAGKSVEELMGEITLPESLELTQSHGKVSWAVKSIWEHYATWFHYDSTTKLYPVPSSAVYADVAEIASAEALLERAKKYLQENRGVHSLHLVEMVLAKWSDHREALQVRLAALELLLKQAEQGLRVDYEMYYLQRRIDLTRQKLKEPFDN